MQLLSLEALIAVNIAVPYFALAIAAVNEVFRPNEFSMIGLWQALALHQEAYQYSLLSKSTDDERLAA